MTTAYSQPELQPSPHWIEEAIDALRFGRATEVSASPGQFPIIQLFNPFGSAVIVVVDKILFSTDPTQRIAISVFNSAIGGLVSLGFNLRSGGAAAVAQLRSSDAVAATTGSIIADFRQEAERFDQIPDCGIALEANQGLHLTGLTANSQLNAGFWWRERPE